LAVVVVSSGCGVNHLAASCGILLPIARRASFNAAVVKEVRAWIARRALRSYRVSRASCALGRASIANSVGGVSPGGERARNHTLTVIEVIALGAGSASTLRSASATRAARVAPLDDDSEVN
jgi:hypothetical protein